MNNLVATAHANAQLLRANQIDWLQAFNAIGDQENAVNAVCWTLDALLDDLRHPAPDERAQVEALRAATQAKLQALQANLRETCLLNGPRSQGKAGHQSKFLTGAALAEHLGYRPPRGAA